MLAARSRAGAASVDLAPALAQVAVAPRSASVDPVAHALLLGGLPIGRLPVRLVAVESALLAVQPVSELFDVGPRLVGRRQAVDDPAPIRPRTGPPSPRAAG